jgi:UDP-glucose 4-epimerase
VSRRAVPVVEACHRSGDPPALIAKDNPAEMETLKSELNTIVQTAWKWHQTREKLKSELV